MSQRMQFGDEVGPEEAKFRAMWEGHSMLTGQRTMLSPEPVRVYTTAPKDYDYSYAIPITDNVGTFNGKPLRLVEIARRSDADYQMGRYGSGMYYARLTPEFMLDVASGHIVLNPTPIQYFRSTINVEDHFHGWSEAKQAAFTDLLDKWQDYLTAGRGGYIQQIEVRGDETTFCKIVADFIQLGKLE